MYFAGKSARIAVNEVLHDLFTQEDPLYPEALMSVVEANGVCVYTQSDGGFKVASLLAEKLIEETNKTLDYANQQDDTII